MAPLFDEEVSVVGNLMGGGTGILLFVGVLACAGCCCSGDVVDCSRTSGGAWYEERSLFSSVITLLLELACCGASLCVLSFWKDAAVAAASDDVSCSGAKGWAVATAGGGVA